jgi:predicted nuclease of restriction endonuclease-like (RecB) superfamily
MSNLTPQEYQATLKELVFRVKQAQYNALNSSEKVQMSWDFGKIISEKATSSNWGSKVIENLSNDLQIEFAGVTGFSFRDLAYMRKFYETYCDLESLHTLSAQISWSHNKVILDKCKDPLMAEFYIKKSINNGWSYFDLKDNISRKLYENYLLSQNNFDKILE